MPFCHLSDDGFQFALYEQQNGTIRFDPDRLECLKLNPLLPNDYNQLGVCRDSDPDNFYESFNCEYFIEDKFNDSIARNYTDEKLSLLHLNTRSLSGNFDKVTNLLFSLNLHFSVIGISETWLKDSDHSCNYVHEHRKGQLGGGVGIYLKEGFDFKVRSDLCFSSSCTESVFVEIIRKTEKNNCWRDIQTA